MPSLAYQISPADFRQRRLLQGDHRHTCDAAGVCRTGRRGDGTGISRGKDAACGSQQPCAVPLRAFPRLWNCLVQLHPRNRDESGADSASGDPDFCRRAGAARIAGRRWRAFGGASFGAGHGACGRALPGLLARPRFGLEPGPGLKRSRGVLHLKRVKAIAASGGWGGPRRGWEGRLTLCGMVELSQCVLFPGDHARAGAAPGRSPDGEAWAETRLRPEFLA